jgi:hypothetical protein
MAVTNLSHWVCHLQHFLMATSNPAGVARQASWSLNNWLVDSSSKDSNERLGQKSVIINLDEGSDHFNTEPHNLHSKEMHAFSSDPTTLGNNVDTVNDIDAPMDISARSGSRKEATKTIGQHPNVAVFKKAKSHFENLKAHNPDGAVQQREVATDTVSTSDQPGMDRSLPFITSQKWTSESQLMQRKLKPDTRSQHHQPAQQLNRAGNSEGHSALANMNQFHHQLSDIRSYGSYQKSTSALNPSQQQFLPHIGPNANPQPYSSPPQRSTSYHVPIVPNQLVQQKSDIGFAQSLSSNQYLMAVPNGVQHNQIFVASSSAPLRQQAPDGFAIANHSTFSGTKPRRFSHGSSYSSEHTTFGHLSKQGRISHVMVQRMYWLKANKLMYVPSGENEPIEAVEIDDDTKIEGPIIKGRYQGFKIEKREGIIILFAKSKEECLLWMNALKQV